MLSLRLLGLLVLREKLIYYVNGGFLVDSRSKKSLTLGSMVDFELKVEVRVGLCKKRVVVLGLVDFFWI